MTSSVSKSICSLKKILLVLALVVLSPLASLKAVGTNNDSEQTDRQHISRQVAQDWFLVGITQHKKGLYSAAESSLLMAKDYQDYLSDDEREKLDELLRQTHSIISEQKRISNEIEAVDKLIKSDKLIEAKAELERIKAEPNINKDQLKKAETLLAELNDALEIIDSKLILQDIKKADALIESGRFVQAGAYLENLKTSEGMTGDILNEIAKRVSRINAQLDLEQRQIAELYVQSLEYYRNNQLDRARESFDRIDKILSERAVLSAKVDEQDALSFEQLQRQVSLPTSEHRVVWQPVVEEPESVGIVDVETEEVETEKDSDIEIVDREIKVLRSYVKAIIKDAVAKSQNYAARDEFRKAKKTIAAAEQLISEYRQYIGEEIFAYYSTLLTQQSMRIAQQEDEAAW